MGSPRSASPQDSRRGLADSGPGARIAEDWLVAALGIGDILRVIPEKLAHQVGARVDNLLEALREPQPLLG